MNLKRENWTIGFHEINESDEINELGGEKLGVTETWRAKRGNTHEW